MTIVFVTGLPGVGKSSSLEKLKHQGYNVIDADDGYIKHISSDNTVETVLDNDKIVSLLKENTKSDWFIAGVYSNQYQIYKYVDLVVLLTVNYNELIKRINERTTNNYGKTLKEQKEITDNYYRVLPLLEESSDTMIDTTNLDATMVCERLKRLLNR